MSRFHEHSGIGRLITVGQGWLFKLLCYLQWEFFFHWVMVNAMGSCLALSATMLTVGRYILGVRIQPQLFSQYLPGAESRLWGFFLTLNLYVSGFSGAQSRIHRRQTEKLEKLSLCSSTDCKVPHWSAFSLLFRVYLFAFYIMSGIFSCTQLEEYREVCLLHLLLELYISLTFFLN